MTLNPLPTYPSTGCYVLKLHRDARPLNGQVSGRLEHISSGEHIDFASAQELLAWLVQHAGRVHGLAQSPLNGNTAP